MELLILLATRQGQLVTRAEISEQLWSRDVFVDTEHGINTAIRKLRHLLHDNPENPGFIQTVTGMGYRFVAPVTRIEAAQTEELPAGEHPAFATQSDSGRTRRPVWLKLGACILALLLIALGAFVSYRWNRQQRHPEQLMLTAVPFTALSGVAANPAFSPDGSRIAFGWSPGPDASGSDQSDLYVKALGSETLLRLTQHPSASLAPSWSPDGTQIAFYRQAGADSGIYVVPALGGPEQKLRSTPGLYNSSISWSPDGKWIAFEDVPPDESRRTIYLLSTDTLTAKRIPINPMCFGEGLPAFSHNGKYLAYWCFRNRWEAAPSFFSLPDGKPQVLAPFCAPKGLTWSADDTKLIYSNWKEYSLHELDEVSIANGSARQLGLEGIRPAVSPKGDKLAYATYPYSSNLWRRDLLHPEAAPVELIASSRPQGGAQYSPDGKHIAFASQRSGVPGVWISNVDGSNLVQISDPDRSSGSPQWSPDGSKIAFDSLFQDRWEIYIADVTERKPRKLITNISFVIRPSWSRDGRWIYFASNGPSKGIYRSPASGGDAMVLSRDPHGVNPWESFDGKTVYFASEDGEAARLKKVPLPALPGTESDVDGSLRVLDWRLSPDGIYFVPVEAPRSVRYFEFASKRVRRIFDGDRGLGSLSISSDGRWILYAQSGDPTGDIMLVDHFH